MNDTKLITVDDVAEMLVSNIRVGDIVVTHNPRLGDEKASYTTRKVKAIIFDGAGKVAVCTSCRFNDGEIEINYPVVEQAMWYSQQNGKWSISWIRIADLRSEEVIILPRIVEERTWCNDYEVGDTLYIPYYCKHEDGFCWVYKEVKIKEISLDFIGAEPVDKVNIPQLLVFAVEDENVRFFSSKRMVMKRLESLSQNY